MGQSNKAKVLILIHSDNGGTYVLAREIAKGIQKDGHVQAVIKQVKAPTNDKLKDIPIATVSELATYDGIALGSPIYFGNMSTAMSDFISKTVDLWTSHSLEGMPATVFMSAGSGAGKDLALQSFWNTLAVHGMVLVANGIRGYEEVDKSIPQGNSVLGTTSLASMKGVERPSISERKMAQLQGENFAKVVLALKGTFNKSSLHVKQEKEVDINDFIKEKGIVLPNVPDPVGNYTPFARSGDIVFISQIALKDGKVLYPGRINKDITENEAKEAVKQTMLNVIAVLKSASGGDLNRVKRCVQLTGIFNTPDGYTHHANLMNPASDLTVEIFGERGRHARGTFGANSIPLNSVVEIQAVFEIE